MLTHPNDSPLRGEPLANFGTTSDHPTHPGGGKIYPPTGRAPKRQESLRRPPHLHDFPPRVEPLAKFGQQPTHTITHMGGSLAKLRTQGGAPQSHPSR